MSLLFFLSFLLFFLSFSLVTLLLLLYFKGVLVICDSNSNFNLESGEGQNDDLGESSAALQTAMKELDSLRDARERTEEMVRRTSCHYKIKIIIIILPVKPDVPFFQF